METENLNVSQLFRSQAVNFQKREWGGSINFAQPMSRIVVSSCSIIVIIAIVAFGLYGTLNRKAHVGGVIVPKNGALSVTTNLSGAVTQIHIKEEGLVKKGQPLITVKNERIGENGDIDTLVMTQLQLRKNGQLQAISQRDNQFYEEDSTIKGRIRVTKTELVQLMDEISLVDRRLRLSEKNLQNNKSLLLSGFISEAQLQQKEQELIAIMSQKKTLERTVTQLHGDIVNWEGQLASIRNRRDSDITLLRNDLALLEQQMVENKRTVSALIRAPESGIISTINVQIGQQLSLSKSVATLIPVSAEDHGVPSLEAQLFVPSRIIGFVEAGQKVFLRYPAYPYQLFGLQEGTVLDVSRTPLSTTELPELLAGTIINQLEINSLSTGREALYRVRIKLASQFVSAYGRDYRLRPGMALEADIVQERQKVWELFFKPVLALVKRSSH